MHKLQVIHDGPPITVHIADQVLSCWHCPSLLPGSRLDTKLMQGIAFLAPLVIKHILTFPHQQIATLTVGSGSVPGSSPCWARDRLPRRQLEQQHRGSKGGHLLERYNTTFWIKRLVRHLRHVSPHQYTLALAQFASSIRLQLRSPSCCYVMLQWLVLPADQIF